MNTKQKHSINLRHIIVLVSLIVAMITAAFIINNSASALECGGAQTSIIQCDGDDGGNGIESSGIWSLLLMAISIMTAGVGVLALAGVVYGAVLYTSAGGNPEQIKKAKGIFINVVIGVVAFAGMFALLNFLIPGGLFN